MRPYVPEDLPVTDLDLATLVPRIGPANAALARYDGLLQSVINPSVMLSPLMNREAVLSSRIEGTQATVDEVLEFEAGFDFEEEKTRDIQEVVNYRRALRMGAEYVSDRPISLSLVRQMHSLLLEGVRGADKSPGEFRRVQNWIGSKGCALEQATFVPPSPLRLLDHLQAWERYLSASEVDVLVQAALAHAQFELIHPFIDGNGRIGRLLVPLFLFRQRLLASPTFYLSEHLETHRDEYLSRLQGISRDRDWTGWVAFFLDAVREQALANAERVRDILALYERMKQRLVELTRSQHVLSVLDALFDRPLFRSSDFVRRSGIPKQTALPFLRKLREAGVLHPLREPSGRRPGILVFRELLDCAEGRPRP